GTRGAGPHGRVHATPPTWRRGHAGRCRRSDPGNAARLPPPTAVSPGHSRIVGTTGRAPGQVESAPLSGRELDAAAFLGGDVGGVDDADRVQTERAVRAWWTFFGD